MEQSSHNVIHNVALAGVIEISERQELGAARRHIHKAGWASKALSGCLWSEGIHHIRATLLVLQEEGDLLLEGPAQSGSNPGNNPG